MKFELQRFRFLPKELKPWVLYVSEEFEIAAHLCACRMWHEDQNSSRSNRMVCEGDRGWT